MAESDREAKGINDNSFFSEISKKIGLFVSGLGFYYLLVYTYRNGIPFPLELSVLPSMILAVGLISILFYFVLVVYFTLGTLLFSEPLVVSEVRRARSLKNKLSTSRIGRWLIEVLLVFGPSVSIGSYLYFVDNNNINRIFVLLLVTAIPSIFATIVFYCCRMRLQRAKHLSNRVLKALILRTFEALFVYIASGIIVMISSSVFFLVLFLSRIATEPIEFLLPGFIFLILNLSLLSWPFPKRYKAVALNTDTHSGNKNTFSWLSQYLVQIVVMGTFAVLSLLPPVAEQLGAVPLRILNIGGDVVKTFSIRKELSQYFPPEILISSRESVCLTRPLAVVLDVGGKIWVRRSGFNASGKALQLSRDELKDYPWSEEEKMQWNQEKTFYGENGVVYK